MNETDSRTQDTGDRRPGGPTCGHQHPLLENIRCQRLNGHPGRHGAYMDAPSTEVTMQWEQEQEQELAG